MNSDFKLIYETLSHDKIYVNSDFLFVEFPYEKNGVSISYLNGGYRKNLKSVFNMHLSTEVINKIDMKTIDKFLSDSVNNIGLDNKKTSGLLTHADMKNTSIITKSYKKVSVTAITTAGTKVNAVRAGDSASYYEENHEYYLFKKENTHEKIGTINTIILINSKLNENSLLNAMVTATEAKAAALQELLIPSQYSNEIATGTGTDGLIIISDKKSDNLIENTGKHSKLGELIGKAVKESIKEANLKQVWISPSSQSTVLNRLYRFKLDINDFYKDFTIKEMENFILNLIKANHNPKMVAITSLIVHLIDEVRYDLLNKKTAYNMSILIINKLFTDKDSSEVKELLKYWINYYLK
ncbi:adenosylcobinamide amidohydrolase [Methanobrevibacter wolinii]|uniref:adenosylcobinamide amidohydrolase n=1 Tax=Methanobrevibacter wolinii TaxID=190977 RepID=UPI0005B2D011|nr:adenosylcobinamide amidohydrolase [Methanobrevibacter wolinii]